MHIKDGKGRGYVAEVNKQQRLETDSTSFSSQARASVENGQAYQVSGTTAITNSNIPILFLQNTSDDKYMVVTYIRVMSIGAAAASAGAYFTVKVGDSYTSGGGALTPVNLNVESGNVAEATAYDGSSSLTLTGGSEIDRNYEANSMQSYNKEGSIVLGRNDAISVYHLGSTVAGTAYARISFYYRDK